MSRIDGFALRRAAAGFLLAAALAVTSPALAADGIGKVTFVNGTVEVERGGSRVSIDAGAEVQRADRFHTGPGARLKIELSDGAEIVLGAGSSFAVVDYLDEPAEDGGGIGFFQHLRGVFLFTGGDTEDRGGEVVVETNVGTIGIRGTEFWGGTLDSDKIEVFVIEGEVSLSNPAGQVTLEPGEGSGTADWGTAPTPAKAWGQAKIDRAVATVALPDGE